MISWGRFSTKTNPASSVGRCADLAIRLVSSGYSCYIRSPKWKWWEKTRQNQTLFASFLEYFGLHLLQPASQDWPARRKNTSNHCFAFINTLQSCLLLFDKTVNHLWHPAPGCANFGRDFFRGSVFVIMTILRDTILAQGHHRFPNSHWKVVPLS